MHTIFMMRGAKDELEKFINELSTRYLNYKVYNKKKKKMEKRLLQMRVSPVQIYDVSFPEEHADAVFTTIYGKGRGKPINTKFEKYAKILRRVLRLKPLPEYKTDMHLGMGFPENLEIIGLGVKKDKWITEDGKLVEEKDKTEFSSEGI